MTWSRLRFCTLVAVAATFFFVGMTRARAAESGSNSAAAQAMFDEAKALVAAGKHREACPKFEESQRLEPTAGTLLNLAACYEQLGQFATAWTKYLEAAAAAEQAHRRDREATARQHAATVSARVARIKIHVSEPVDPALDLSRDGQTVGRAQWDVAIPVDPGVHSVVAALASQVSWSIEVTVPPRPATIEVTVPPLTALPPAASSAPAGSEALTDTEPRSADTTAAARRDASGRDSPAARARLENHTAAKHPHFYFGPQRVVGLLIAAGGTAALGVGMVYGSTMLSKRDEASRRCPGATCDDPTVAPLRAAARQARSYAVTALIAGGVGVVGGALLWLTGGAANDDGDARARGVRIGAGPGWLELRGNF